MKYLKIIIFVLGITFVGCKNEPKVVLENTPEIENSNDKEEIEKLIKDVLNWSWTNPNEKAKIDLLPIISDEKNSIYIGFDFEKHKMNLKILKETGFFADMFIENYDKIIKTIDKKIKSNEYDTWEVGMLPTFKFSTDADPWCNCQDVPYDESFNELIKIEIQNLDNQKAEAAWTWKNTEWAKNFNYKIKVVKINNKWMVSYLEGFDYEKGIEKSYEE